MALATADPGYISRTLAVRYVNMVMLSREMWSLVKMMEKPTPKQEESTC